MHDSSSGSSRPHLRVRALRADDRTALLQLLRRTGAFSDDEVAVALELIDIGERPEPDGYRFLVAEVEDGRVAGYACWGLTPLTDGVYDLYWIAVEAQLHGRGIGRAILDAVEQRVRAGGGRMVLIETASKPEYAATRAFYAATGYVEVARVPDFYRVGDDKIIYGKTLAPR